MSESQLIRVSGAGRVSQAPDLAVLSLAVSCLRADANTAVADADSYVRAVQVVVSESDSAASCLSTDLTVRAEDAWDGNNRKRLGVRAGHSLKVKVTKIDQLGEVIGKILAVGGDDLSLDDVKLMCSNEAELQIAARELAFKDAHDKAQQLAALAGRELGNVIRIVEVSAGEVMPRAYGSVMQASAISLSINPSDVESGVQIEAAWQLV